MNRTHSDPRPPLTLTRRTLLTTVGIAGIATATGCSSGSEPASTDVQLTVPDDIVQQAKKHQGEKLTFLSQKLYSEAANTALDDALGALADAAGIEIENSQASADTGDLVAKTDAAVKAGNARDMGFFSDSRFIAQFHDLGDLTDVTDVVEELTDTLGKPAAEAETYCKFDGKWYGIPYQFIGGGAFARKDWLQEKGIELADSYTYDEMRDICLEISDPQQRRYGWGLTINRSGDGSGFVESVINNWGGAISDNDGTKVVLNSPETVDAVVWLADTYGNEKYKPMLPPGIESWTDNSNNENWLAGITGFTRNQFSVYADSKSSENPVYENTHAFLDCTGPATDRPVAPGQSQALVILKGSQQADLAKITAKYLVSGAALLNIAKNATGLAMPAWEKVWDSDPYYTSGDPAFSMIKDQVVQELPIETKTGFAFPQKPNSGQQAAQASFVLTDMMQEVLAGTPPKDAVAEAHDRTVKLFDQSGVGR